MTAPWMSCGAGGPLLPRLLARAHAALGAGAPILRCMLARPIALLVAIIPAAAMPQDSVALVTVPALTPVTVRLEELISSNKNKPGDRFRITVAEDVRVGEQLVIPAGSA